MPKPRNAIEWLYDKIAYSPRTEDLRGYALCLLLMVDSDQIQDVFQDEMASDGYFDEDDEYMGTDRSWITDEEGWNTAIDLRLKWARRKLKCHGS